MLEQILRSFQILKHLSKDALRIKLWLSSQSLCRKRFSLFLILASACTYFVIVSITLIYYLSSKLSVKICFRTSFDFLIAYSTLRWVKPCSPNRCSTCSFWASKTSCITSSAIYGSGLFLSRCKAVKDSIDSLLRKACITRHNCSPFSSHWPNSTWAKLLQAIKMLRSLSRFSMPSSLWFYQNMAQSTIFKQTRQ